MPQDVIIPVDFPHAVNPDIGRAYARELRWGDRYRVTDDPVRWQRIRAAEPGKLVGYTAPDARGSGYDLAVDQMCFFFYFDNLVEELFFDAPAQAAPFIQRMADILDPDIPPGLHDRSVPAVAMLADLWADSSARMSWQWRHRAAGHWMDYLWANLAEAVDRHRGTTPASIGSYLRIRRASIGLTPVLDMYEVSGGFEVPAGVYRQSDIRRLQTLACDLTVLGNDLVSHDKEDAVGDTYNAVIILRDHHGLSERQAIGQVSAEVVRRAAEFHHLRARLPGLCDALDFDTHDRALGGPGPQQRRAIRLPVPGTPLCPREATLSLAQCLHTWVGGHFDWMREAPRYASDHATPVGRLAEA
ncbi:terpene synthase family protein [Streptomyces sp. NPDC021096]|uniref:terpene synthase family protein n=1 Tax=Streptomyces sp. NPDC021096 TaxID=3154792 RepID=UPI0033DF8B1B